MSNRKRLDLIKSEHIDIIYSDSRELEFNRFMKFVSITQLYAKLKPIFSFFLNAEYTYMGKTSVDDINFVCGKFLV